MIKSSVFVLCGALMTLHCANVVAADRSVGWNLTPNMCVPLATGPNGLVVVSDISAGSNVDGPEARIDVDEENNHNAQWESAFANLHAGAEFVVGNEIYEVSSIKVLPPFPATHPGNKAIVGGDCVEGRSHITVRDTKRQVLDDNQDAVILPAQAGTSAWIGDQCTMAVKVVSVEQKQQIAVLEWHQESMVPWKTTCDKGKSTSGALKINDVLDMHEYGRFRVRAIFPQTEKHPDWVVLLRN